MKGIPPVKAVMTPFPYFIEGTASVATAEEMMRLHRIRHLPVMEGGELVGLISDRDVHLVRDPRRKTPPDDRTVGEICKRDVYTVGLTDPLDEVLEQMARRHIGSALVVRHGKLAGIFTVTDACRLFADLLQSLFPSQKDQEPA